jgi:excisionase family DNA binding protein
VSKTEKIALSVSEAAEALGVSRVTLYQYIRRQDFPSARIGRRVLIPRDKLKEWLEAQMEGTK